MAGIFGGQSSSRGGGLQGSMQGPGPRNFAGDQAGGFRDPMDTYDQMLHGQKDLYAWKQQQDLDMHNKMNRQQYGLSTGRGTPLEQEQLRQMQLQNEAMAARNKAASGPMPTKMLYGFNVIPGRVADPNAMNAYQRELFLPQQSTISGGGGPSSAGLTPASASQQAAAVNPQAEQAGTMARNMRMHPGMMQRMFPQMYKSGRMMDDPAPQDPNDSSAYI